MPKLRKSEAHSSHHVVNHAIGPYAIWACHRCGCVAADTMKGLSQPCKKKRNQAGKQNLSRLERKLLPGSSARAKAYNMQTGDIKPKPRRPQ